MINARTWRRAVAIGALALTTMTTEAAAQGLANLSCGQLWHERNAIFARYGHCFQTQRAINAFGRGCFPPFGRLPAHAQSRVNEIISWESRKGCS